MNHNNKKNGFTLLETIVAVSILVTAIVGPFTLASQSIKTQSIAKNNLIAANLAQESIELFRNFRANNILKMQDDFNDGTISAPDYSRWLDGADACIGVPSSAGCGIDAFTYIQAPPNSEDNFALPSCGALNNCTLYLNDTTGVYSHTANGSTPTKFHRKITIQEVTLNPPEIKVTATVWWGDSFGSDTFSVTTHLMNW